MFDLGAPELILILVIILVLFGGAKLPELSKSIGISIRELRKGLNGDISDTNEKKSSSDSEKKA